MTTQNTLPNVPSPEPQQAPNAARTDTPQPIGPALPVPAATEPIPPGAGPSLFGHHMKFYGSYGFGRKVLQAPHLGDTPPTSTIPGMNTELEQRLRKWVMLRGLRRNNRAYTAEIRRDARALEDHLRQHGTPAEAQPVPRLDIRDLPRDWLLETWMKAPYPVILRGVQAPAFDWTVDKLVAQFGDTPVVATTDGAEHLEMPLREARSRDDVYVHNNGRLFVEHPELIEQLATQSLAPMFGVDMTIAQLFVGHRKTSSTAFHCANNINGVYMCEGRKHWTLVDPAHTMLMYPWLSDFNTYQASLVGVPGPDSGERFPLYRYCPRFEVTLEHGDLLLNPPWWWHAVRCETEHTVSAATRWYPDTMPDTNRLFSFLHAEPRFVGHILGTMFGFLLRRTMPNLWLIFEDTAHDDAAADSMTDSARAAWGLS